MSELTLIDQLLKEQKELTAVERFSQKHESANDIVLEPHYQDLIPIRKPSTGEQYAFQVDLDKCTGCKACVVACHSLNGLHENESWRDIGVISGEVKGVAQQQTVTSACHHCADPGCLSGCPVGAYDKDIETGIVRHLDDQCIGCQYCSLKCPYDVPKYDDALGIVRKCDMCHDRLAEGEAPACVQSCPNGAIQIQLVKVAEVKQSAKGGAQMIAGAYRSDYTYPTTTFITDRELDVAMQAADQKSLKASHAHTPLVWMLMLTQVAVGVSFLGLLASVVAPLWSADLHPWLAVIAVALGMVGLGSSMLHLGSPLGAWRVFLGLKTSWLSREIIIFGGWMPALIGYAALAWYPKYQDYIPSAIQQWLPESIPSVWLLVTLTGAVALGLASVFCSVMVYVDTQRAFWSLRRTVGRFYGTVLLGGSSVLLAVSSLIYGSVPGLLIMTVVVSWLLKLIVELNLLLPAQNSEWSLAKQSALIQLKTLRKLTLIRYSLLALSMILLLFIAITGNIELYTLTASLALLIAIFTIAGEWLERRLFFQAVVTLKMPGMVN